VRLDLGDGQWADLRERLTYAQAKPIRVVWALVDKGGDAASWADLDMALIVGYVSAWNVLDLQGNAVPLDTPEAAPDDLIQKIALEAVKVWKGTAGVPKAGKKRLPLPPQALRSA
jgi:hypothetical protein